MVVHAKRIVIDASVALKQTFSEEDHAAQSNAIFQDYVIDAVHLLAPTLFDYEIANVLRSAVLRKRLMEEEAHNAMKSYENLAIARPDFRETQITALELALRYQRSTYDCAYLALAQISDLWFYTGDRKLYYSVSSPLSYVKWIGNYDFAAIPDTNRLPE